MIGRSEKSWSKGKSALGDTRLKKMTLEEGREKDAEQEVETPSIFLKNDPSAADAVDGVFPDAPAVPVKRKPGRPKGSKNGVRKPEAPKRKPGRPKKETTKEPAKRKFVPKKSETGRPGEVPPVELRKKVDKKLSAEEKALWAELETAEEINLSPAQIKQIRTRVMHRVKRPEDMVDEQWEAIFRSISGGSTLGTAASGAAVNRALAETWYREGSIPGCADKGLARFAAFIDDAKGRAERIAIGIVKSAALSGNWQSAAWLLERSNPFNFSLATDRLKNDLAGAAVGLKTSVDVGSLTNEQLMRLAAGDFSDIATGKGPEAPEHLSEKQIERAKPGEDV